VPDPFRVIWNRADAAEPVYTADEVASWPPGVFDRLAVLGLLCESTNAATVVCDACDGSHAEEVVYLEFPAGTGLRGYICCPEAGRVSVPLERLRRWTICFDRLAALTALALEAVGGVEEILPSRVWLLGTARLAGRLHEVFLIRGITGEDGPEIVTSVRRLRDSSRPIILVSGSAPASAAGPAIPTVVPLSALVSGDAAEFALDRVLLHELLQQPGTSPGPIGEERAASTGSDEDPLGCGGWLFVPSGDGYFIAGFGESGHLSKYKGLANIARLIRTPGRPVPMLELAGAEQRLKSDRKTRQPALGPEEVRQARAKLGELHSDLERAKAENDSVTADITTEEIQQLEDVLRAATGLGGKARDLNNLYDRLRPTISGRLQTVYKAMKAANPPMPLLAQHFELSISCEGGSGFVYQPAGNPPPWQFQRAGEK
jgi:hypothetical protein